MNRVLISLCVFSVSFFFFLFKRTLSQNSYCCILFCGNDYISLPYPYIRFLYRTTHYHTPISLYCTLLYIVLFVVEAKPCSFGCPSANLPFMFMYDDWLIKESRQLTQSEICLSSNPLPRWTPGPMGSYRRARKEFELS